MGPTAHKHVGGLRGVGSGEASQTISLGRIGTIGHGSGVGSGYGYGYGGGGMGKGMAANLPEPASADAYAHQDENGFRSVKVAPLSTFSVDVDTASYSNVRHFLTDGQLPPVDAVRIEELVNYFPYAYAPPTGNAPFSASTELATCPWMPTHQLLRIGIKARELDSKQRPASNLVFLVDVSGSMSSPDRLPLLKRALGLLVETLDARDHVAIVVYAGSAGTVLPSTRGDQRATILAALGRLESGGSTNGGAGIEEAYRLAQAAFTKGGSNRVVLATDGDFNVGVTSEGALVRLVEEKAKHGVYLSVLGFGRGNLKDATMEKLADRGNGNYAYIDTLQEARKVLVEQMTGTLITVAKDVKLQLELNPARVSAYRQLGYEDRQLRNEDFNDDRVDAGDIGAGHTVTALYEIVPVGVATKLATVDPLKYQTPTVATGSSELATVKIRYKPASGGPSTLSSFPVAASAGDWQQASVDWKLAASVAETGMLLRGSKNRGAATWATALELAREGRGDDPHGYRAELSTLIETARKLRALGVAVR
ncbi:MAG: VWA domain-containing protein [Polyangia bacterium]